MNPTRILIVDDEASLRTTMAELLRADDREIVVAASGEEAMAYLEDGPFDLLIVDLVMPGIDGLQVMDMAHKLSPQAKLIMLTAYGTLDSSVQALRREAVDFLTKPASAPEIEAAVERALRKRYEEARREELLGQIQSAFQELRGGQERTTTTTAAHPRRERFLQSRNIIIDLQKHIVTIDGQTLDLTPTELRLLSTLIANADQVMSCRELVYQVQNYETDEREARSIIRVYIRRLRQKIEPDPAAPTYILNVRGAGYMFSSSDTARPFDTRPFDDDSPDD